MFSNVLAPFIFYQAMASLYKQLYLYATLFYVSYTFNFPTVSNRISTSSGNFKAVEKRVWAGKLPALEDYCWSEHRFVAPELKNFESVQQFVAGI